MGNRTEYSLQAEYRYREADEGDLVTVFNRDEFSTSLRRNVDEKVGRVGFLYSPNTNTDVIASAFYADRDEEIDPSGLAAFDDGYQL